MKTLGRSVILLVCYVYPAHAQQVMRIARAAVDVQECLVYRPGERQDQAAGGNGSQAHPWNSLEAVTAAVTATPTALLTTAPICRSSRDS